MSSAELFDEIYYGAKDESELLTILVNHGYKSGDFSQMDYPKQYPCLFRIHWNYNPNGRDWGTLYVYYEEDLRRFYNELGTILDG